MIAEDTCLAILDIAGEMGLMFGAGHCGSTAIAINRVLFGGEGTYQAVVNTFLWSKGRFVGHIGVLFADQLWDASGLYAGSSIDEDFCSWGLLDPEDPDYYFQTEEQAYDYRYFSLSLSQIEKHLPTSYQKSALDILRAARSQYENRSAKSLQHA